MRIPRVVGSFYRYPDADLAVTVGTIIGRIDESDFYTDTDPPMEQLEAAYREYLQLLSISYSRRGGRADNARKNESKKRLARLVQKLAAHVNSRADGNLTLLLSSGFPLSRRRTAGSVPDIPSDPRLTDGEVSGSVRLDFGSVGRDVLYEYAFRTMELAEVRRPSWGEPVFTGRSRKNIIDGLVPGTRIEVRVRARNRYGASNWSHTVSLVVR